MTGWLASLSGLFAGLALCAFGAVTLWLMLQPGARMRALMPSRGALVAVTGSLALWSGGWFIYGANSPQVIFADVLRNLAFVAWLAMTFRGTAKGAQSQSIRLILLTLIVIDLVAAVFAGFALLDVALGGLPIRPGLDSDGMRLVDMVTASGGLLLVEHFARHRGEGVRMPVIVVGGGIAALWAYTLNIHLLGWLSGSAPSTLIALEPLFALFVLPALVLVALDTGRDRIRLSRTIAVRTLAIFGLAVYLTIMAVTGAFAQLVGGDYGELAQGVLLILALGSGAIFFALPRARAWLMVMLSKHFFEHRYDYRAEWMRFTATIEGQEGDNDPPFRRIARALGELAGSPAVLVMTADADGNYRTNDHWQWPAALDGSDQIATREAYVLQERTLIVDVDELRSGGDRNDQGRIMLPQWMLADQRIWVVMPLLHLRRMVGIAVLQRPVTPRQLDWEDLDVLRISGRQAASHIAEMQSQAELSEARRFDEFNRRFAFIMHDVKIWRASWDCSPPMPNAMPRIPNFAPT
ncbi:MAG: hypothetical protein HC788_04675 [Sphingopyxis sp.]|nr:hypothetical protein [Sphingopyxis sp.]